jgi:hypothetical protein
MAKKEVKVEAPKAPVLKYKVIQVVDYLNEARQYFGEDNSYNNAVALIYTKNKIVAVVNHKGEDRFVAEV